MEQRMFPVSAPAITRDNGEVIKTKTFLTFEKQWPGVVMGTELV